MRFHSEHPLSDVPPHPESAAFSVEEVLLRLGIALVLVLANGFFVAAEFSLVGSRTTRIQEMASSGQPASRPLGRAMFGKLKVYAGEKHPHQAQKPATLDAAQAI